MKTAKKMQKKVAKNEDLALQSKKPVFVPPLSKSDYVERTSAKPVGTFVPHQALSLRVLVDRFEHGQRLNVHQNFKPLSNMTEGKIYEESFDDAPPADVHDVVDVHNYYEQHKQHVKEYQQRKKEASKQAKQAKAQQAKQDPTPAPAPPAE